MGVQVENLGAVKANTAIDTDVVIIGGGPWRIELCFVPFGFP